MIKVNKKKLTRLQKLGMRKKREQQMKKITMQKDLMLDRNSQWVMGNHHMGQQKLKMKRINILQLMALQAQVRKGKMELNSQWLQVQIQILKKIFLAIKKHKKAPK